MSAPRSVVVVGAGLAGFSVGHALRRAGFRGPVTVLGAEPHPPYDRPPLSKGFLTGAVTAAGLHLDDPSAPLDVEWVPGAAAAGLTVDPAGWAVTTEDGRRCTAEAVVLATGADAVALGPAVPGTHVLRTLADAEALRADGVAGRDVLVIGFGFIGLESAAAAAALGAASVTVVAPEPVPLADRLGAAVGDAVAGLHRRHGVVLRGGATVTTWEAGPDGRIRAVGIHDADGVHTLPTDLVICGVGVRPATGWLADAVPAGLALAPDGGVLCGPDGRTGIPGVWAVGDCARWTHTERPGLRRAGHWQDCPDQAAVVAAGLLGRTPPSLPQPYFWSDQFGVTLQLAGHLEGDEVAVVRAGSVEGADLLVGYERDGVEVALLGMDRPRDLVRWRRTRDPRRTPTTQLTGTGAPA